MIVFRARLAGAATNAAACWLPVQTRAIRPHSAVLGYVATSGRSRTTRYTLYRLKIAAVGLGIHQPVRVSMANYFGMQRTNACEFRRRHERRRKACRNSLSCDTISDHERQPDRQPRPVLDRARDHDCAWRGGLPPAADIAKQADPDQVNRQ